MRSREIVPQGGKHIENPEFRRGFFGPGPASRLKCALKLERTPIGTVEIKAWHGRYILNGNSTPGGEAPAGGWRALKGCGAHSDRESARCAMEAESTEAGVSPELARVSAELTQSLDERHQIREQELERLRGLATPESPAPSAPETSTLPRPRRAVARSAHRDLSATEKRWTRIVLFALLIASFGISLLRHE